jgi:hypothetical protein
VSDWSIPLALSEGVWFLRARRGECEVPERPEHVRYGVVDVRSYLVEDIIWAGGSSCGRVNRIDKFCNKVIIETGEQGIGMKDSGSNWR